MLDCVEVGDDCVVIGDEEPIDEVGCVVVGGEDVPPAEVVEPSSSSLET